MTAFEFYALFGAPFLMLLAGLAVIWITGWQDKREARKRHAAE
jgi:hypothetical protein